MDDSVRVGQDARDRVPLALQGVGRVTHGVVLDGAHDHVAALERKRAGAADHAQVVGLGAAAREDDLRGRGVQERGHLRARVLDSPTGLLTEGVGAGGVPEVLAEIGEHRLEDLGADGGAGIVIEVDAGQNGTLRSAQVIKYEGMEGVIPRRRRPENGRGSEASCALASPWMLRPR